VRWTATFPFPDFTLDVDLVSLRHPDEYPFNEGRLVSSAGLDIPVEEFGDHVVEEHVARSNALHARLRERGAFLTGPLARYGLNFDRLSPLAQEAAREAGLGPVCHNPFQSIVVRAVEILHACDEALRLIEQYEEPDQPALAVAPRAGTGHAATEAPRGTLYHRYTIDEQGLIQEATIVPPTSQNQKAIESDLASFAQAHLSLPKAELTLRCEQVIRNYDPCISCATHFLELHVEHG
jgi:coenzyme F420-reducing hydrogenase alpha subunit